MAVQNLCLAAHAMGLGHVRDDRPAAGGEVWSRVAGLPAGFRADVPCDRWAIRPTQPDAAASEGFEACCRIQVEGHD